MIKENKKQGENELKTLKEIYSQTYSSCNCGDYNEGCVGCLKKQIKLESVKWLKEHRKRLWRWTEDTWRDFFDIYDEDLK